LNLLPLNLHQDDMMTIPARQENFLKTRNFTSCSFPHRVMKWGQIKATVWFGALPAAAVPRPVVEVFFFVPDVHLFPH
jgi:hypothetical protein